MFCRYDLVLHMVTAADGAEKFFSQQGTGTVVRSSPEAVKARDIKVRAPFKFCSSACSFCRHSCAVRGSRIQITLSSIIRRTSSRRSSARESKSRSWSSRALLLERLPRSHLLLRLPLVTTICRAAFTPRRQLGWRMLRADIPSAVRGPHVTVSSDEHGKFAAAFDPVARDGSRLDLCSFVQTLHYPTVVVAVRNIWRSKIAPSRDFCVLFRNFASKG